MNVQVIKQVFAELLFLNQLLQGRAGGRDEANVDQVAFVASQRAGFSLCQNPQKFGLNVDRQIGDLIHEQGAAFRFFEQTFAILRRAGKRAFDMPKQLALNQVDRNRAAVTASFSK